MPLIITGAPISTSSYASLAVFRAYAPDNTDTDEAIAAALTFADALINGRAGRTFQRYTHLTVYDVRTDTVVFNYSGTVDEAYIQGTFMSPSTYELVSDWGLRFYAPSKGTWHDPERPLTVEPLRSWWRGDGTRGVTVELVGTFGEAPSDLIKRAAILLALDELSGTTTTSSSVSNLPGTVKSYSESVEGSSQSWTLADDGTASKQSTGNAQADRLIDMATRKGRVGVA